MKWNRIIEEIEKCNEYVHGYGIRGYYTTMKKKG